MCEASSALQETKISSICICGAQLGLPVQLRHTVDGDNEAEASI